MTVVLVEIGMNQWFSPRSPNSAGDRSSPRKSMTADRSAGSSASSWLLPVRAYVLRTPAAETTVSVRTRYRRPVAVSSTSTPAARPPSTTTSWTFWRERSTTPYRARISSTTRLSSCGPPTGCAVPSMKKVSGTAA